MSSLKGKVAIVTGAGRGLGRSHALALAREGAAVVVNDLGTALDGGGRSSLPAEEVVDAICAAGGEAIANADDCADWKAAERLIELAVSRFGRLDIIVNNAGIIRDRMSFNMEEAEFDDVIRVHLKGHFSLCRHAARYWRAQHKAGAAVSGRIINTTSEAGLFGTPGQANYAAAKAGIVAMTLTLGRELAAFGVTANAISPRAMTRFTEGLTNATPTPVEAVSPLVVYLSGDEAADVNGKVFVVHGGYLACMDGWRVASWHESGAPLTLPEVKRVIDHLLPSPESRAIEKLPV